MRHIRTIPILALLALVAIGLTSCGQPLTRAEFERTHPWTSGMEVIAATPANGMVATVVYPDRMPRLEPGPLAGQATYTRTPGIHVLRIDQAGEVVSCRWQDDAVLR